MSLDCVILWNIISYVVRYQKIPILFSHWDQKLANNLTENILETGSVKDKTILPLKTRALTGQIWLFAVFENYTLANIWVSLSQHQHTCKLTLVVYSEHRPKHRHSNLLQGPKGSITSAVTQARRPRVFSSFTAAQTITPPRKYILT